MVKQLERPAPKYDRGRQHRAIVQTLKERERRRDSRATEDIDLLIESSPENQARVKKALEVFPDKAVRELGDDDLRNYLVVRVADEVVVDLMLKACGIGYEEASREIETVRIRDVSIPFASPKLLLRMKQTHREKDELDRKFLERKIKGSKS